MSRSIKKQALFSGMLAAMIGLLIMLPAIIKYGGIFAIKGDYISQHITRVLTAKRMLWSGSVPQWDWTSFLGTEYSYWRIFFSFDSICLIMPESAIPYALTFTNLIRFFVMGLTSFLFINRFVRRSESAIIGALVYTFSSYTLVSFEFMLFLDAAALFPFLLLALEKRFTDEKYRFVFILAVFLNAMAWAYLFIGTSLAMLVYALIRFFASEEWRPRRKLRYILLCIAEYAIGVMLCGFFLLIFVKSMFGTSRATATLAGGVSFKSLLIPRHLFDVIAAVFLPAASNRTTEFFTYTSWYSMHACIPVFGFAFCIASLLRRRLKDSLNLILIAYLAVSVFPILNGISSFYANEYTRWWYALALIIAVVSVREYESLDDYDGRLLNRSVGTQWAAVVLIPVLFYAVYALRNVGFAPLKSIIAVFFIHDYSYGFAEELLRIFVIGFGVLFASALTAIAYSRRVRRYSLALISVCIVLFGAGYTALNNSDAAVFDEVFRNRSDITMKEIVSEYYTDPKVRVGQPYEYRVDCPNTLLNYAAVIDAPCICYYESTLDTDATRFAVFAGMGNPADVYFEPRDNSNELRTLLSVKYYYHYCPEIETVPVPNGFRYLYHENGADVYENVNYIPFGFAYDDYITESELESYEDASVSTLLHTLVIEDGDAEFIGGYLPHCTDLTADLQTDVEKRGKCTSASFSADPEGFTAEFESDATRVIFFSVPYDEGWHAFIDGEPVGFIRANLGFMAIVLPEGRHTVTFGYRNSALIPGLMISAVGALCCAAYISLSLCAEKKRLKAG